MNELYYFTPFVFINESQDNIIIQTGVNFKIEIKRDAEFVKAVSEHRGFTFSELLKWFSSKQIISMFKNNIIIEHKFDDIGRYSRTNGYYLTSKNNTAEKSLAKKKVLILGAGAIGSHVAWMLSTLGIKNLDVLDFDVVEESNLNRQLLYDQNDINKPKAEALKRHILEINPDMNITAFQDKIVSKEQLKDYISQGYDMVVRAIDTPPNSVAWLNEVCVELKVPYTSGGFLEYYGVIGPTYIPDISPCYSCYKNEALPEKRLYGTGPTIAMLTEYVASKVSFEVLNVLTRKKNNYNGRMEIYDSVANTSRFEIFEKEHDCPICGKKWTSESKDRNTTVLSSVYMLLIGLGCFLVSIEGWAAYLTLIMFCIIQLFPLMYEKDSDAYRISFLGGTLYGITSLVLTMRLNGGILNTGIINGGNFLASNIVGMGLNIIITVSISILIFTIITFIYRQIKNLILNHRKVYSTNVHYSRV